MRRTASSSARNVEAGADRSSSRSSASTVRSPTRPNNFIWVKSATLDFYKPRRRGADVRAVSALDPRSTPSFRRDATIEKLADGFLFTEGPVWVRDGGYLLFSDPNHNTHLPLDAGRRALRLPHARAATRGADIAEYGQPGSNGLTLDREGRLTIDEHGNRRVMRLEKNGALTVLADRYEGKRLNSPNDLVYKSDGALYFTDPPFGLPKFFDDPRKELPFSGVFRVARRASCTLVDQGPDRPERPRLLAGREVPLRRQLGREEEGRDALRGERRRHARRTARCSST